jgi:hypothetical protein
VSTKADGAERTAPMKRTVNTLASNTTHRGVSRTRPRDARADEIVAQFLRDLRCLHEERGGLSLTAMAMRREQIKGIGGSRASFERYLNRHATKLPTPAVLHGLLTVIGADKDTIAAWQERRRCDVERIDALRSGEPDPQQDDQTKITDASRPRNGPRWVASAAIVAVMSVTITVLMTEGSGTAARQTTVNGFVSCQHAAHVVGVWIKPAHGPAGWARLRPRGSTAGWQRDVDRGSSYSVDVGCGGTPHDWASNNSSPPISGATSRLDCTAPPRLPNGFTAQGKCFTVP